MICTTKDKSENANCWAPLNAFVRFTLKTCKHKKELKGGGEWASMWKLDEHYCENQMNINVKVRWTLIHWCED